MLKHLLYLRYVLLHKWYVFVECCRVGLYWRGLLHDLSKFTFREWIPYVNHFYGSNVEGGRDHAFDAAWAAHIRRNPHHWQNHILHEDDGDTVFLAMSEEYIKEMVADWRGAGRAQGFGDNTVEWWKRNKDIIKLHTMTRKRVIELLHERC